MSTTFTEICKKLRDLQPYDFEVVCNDYLKARYPNLTPWISTNVPRSIAGTPDAFVIDDAGRLVACQYGSTDKWRSKLLNESEKNQGDAKKVADLAKAHGLKVKRLIFGTIAELKSWERRSAQRKAKRRFGFPVEICDLRRLAHDLEVLYPGIAARRLDIPIPLQHFMTLDKYLDSSNPRYWPKRADLEEGLLYSPEEHISHIRELLLREGSCLLTGKSGAGKTVLSIAFALQWCEEHPEAVVFYLDADGSRPAEIGEDWYRQVLTYDYQNALYVIDNYHLSVAAINAFCGQWARRPAEKARLILISRPRAEASEWEEEPEDYFVGFEDAETVLSVEPESIYQGMLCVCSDAYRSREKTRYVPVEEELADAEIAAKLEVTCGHNLVFAHYLLETWKDEGGRLSEITEEKVLERLSRRYLTRQKNIALPPLCALAQFEIFAHGEFVRQHLPAVQVKTLLAEKLLFAENTLFYGECYRLAFHPQNAALLFRADVKRRVGANYAARADAELFSTLKTYLASQPENFADVYRRIYHSGNVDLQHQLLQDEELQAFAVQQFEQRLLNDMALYLYSLSNADSQRAEELLGHFINRISLNELRKQVESLDDTSLTLTAYFLVRVKLDTASKLFAGFEAKDIAKRISRTNFGNIQQWISSSPNCLAVQLGYPETWRCDVAESLDISALAIRAQQESLQPLFWLVHALKVIAPSQAKALLDTFSPKDLAQKMSKGDLSSTHKLFQYLDELGYDTTSRRHVAESLDLSALATRAKQEGLQQPFWLMRGVKTVAPKQAINFENILTPRGLAEMFRDKEATAKNLQQFSDVCSRGFFQQFFKQFKPGEISDIFSRSKLANVGSFLEYRYYAFSAAYADFANLHLPAKLAEAPIVDIGKFIARIQKVLEEGEQLARDALELLLTVDLTARVTKSDVEGIAGLLYSAYTVDADFSRRLLELPNMPDAIEQGLKHSGIQGIQLLLHNLSEIAPDLLQRIGGALHSLDLTNRLAGAEIGDIAHFLWNIYSHVDAELAREYCQVVDAQARREQIRKATLDELGRFLWNLVHISGTDVQTLDEPLILERLHVECSMDFPQCVYVLGIIATARPNAISSLDLPTVDFAQVSEELTEWLAQAVDEEKPYLFALTLRGLRALNERWSDKIIAKFQRDWQTKLRCLALLNDAKSQAVVTEKSRMLLEEYFMKLSK